MYVYLNMTNTFIYIIYADGMLTFRLDTIYPKYILNTHTKALFVLIMIFNVLFLSN